MMPRVGNDIWVGWTFPPDNLAVEYLLVSSTARVGKGSQVDNYIQISFWRKRVVSWLNP